MARSRRKSDKLNEKIMEAWREWCQFCDADGDLDFFGLQALAARAMFESGECFIRFRDIGFSNTMRVPLQLQVLEADFLDTAKTTKGENGNVIRQGIEFDSQNRRVAYWMWPQHPGEAIVGKTRFQSVRVPADQILHVFRKLRPGQYPTIGYGHLITEANKERFLDGVDEEEALELLRSDVGKAERAVLRLITVPLTQGQFDALVSFTFNLGAGALQRSTLRRKVNRKEHADVPAELMKWVWAGGRKLKGLVKRRRAEANLYDSTI